MECIEQECSARAKSRGYCGPHYSRARRQGMQAEDRSGQHRISEINSEGRTGTCSICGPVPLRLRPKSRGGVECSVKYKQQKVSSATRNRSKRNATRNAKDRATREAIRAGRLEAQGGVCGICQGEFTRPPNIDHDHSCCPGGKYCENCIRGILCHLCNVGLGAFKDSSDVVARALAYLRAYEERPA